MFFYRQLSPLVLSSSTNSILFGNIIVNSTSSQTLNVSALGVGFTETITVSDNSNQFDFSPGSFQLTTGGSSQTITVVATPTSLGVKTATLTLSASGGNVKNISLQATASNDLYFQNVSLLLNGDGPNNSTNIIDSSSNNFTVTVNGNTKISTAQSKYGGSSIFFDGIGDYLDFNTVNTTAFAFGTGSFTIEFWIRSSSANGNLLNPANLSGGSFWGLIIQSSNLRWNNSYNSTNLWQVGAASILDNNWHHVAISRSSSTTRVFFDGILQNTFTDTTNYAYTNGGISDGLRMGKGNLADLSAYIDDLRITKDIARYTANFTPPGAL